MLLSTIGCVDVDMIKLSDHHTSRHPTWLCKKKEHISLQQSAYYIMWCMKCLISSCICIYELICAHSNHMYIYIYCLACTAAHQLPTHSAFWPKTSCIPSLHSTMATVVEQVIRRLDTARDVMSRITTQQHAKVSSLQKSAVSELLVAAITQGVSAEDVAMLTDKCVAANFLPADLDELLSVLAQKAAEKRRKQQNFLFASNYVSEGLWKKLLSPELDLQMRCDIWVQHVTRLACINPTEPSCKRWVAELLCMQHSREELQSISKDSKVSLMKHLKISLKKQVRCDRSVFVYLHELPADPADLASKHPEFYNRLFSDSTAAAVLCKRPAKNPLDQTLVMAVDVSFNCRGGGGFEAPAPSPRVQGSDMQQCMQMFMSMVGGMMQPGLARDPLASLQINRGRSFAALQSAPPALQPAPLALQPAPLAVTVGGQAADIDRAKAGQVAGIDHAQAGQSAGIDHAQAGQSAGIEHAQACPAAGIEHAQAGTKPGLLQIEDRQSMLEQPPESEVPEQPQEPQVHAQSGHPMLDAILARAAAKKKPPASHAKKDVAPAASAARKETAASAAKKDVAPAKKAGAAVASVALPVATCPPSSKKARKSPDASPVATVATPARVGMSHEKSRSQFLVRVTGTGSTNFRYAGCNAAYKSEAAAKKAALELVRQSSA
jgi:hypothetical protein